MSKNLFVQDDFVIEGFDPDKLSELKKKASSGNGWQEIMGAYQNQKILKGRVRGIQEVGSAKKTCAMVMVKDIQGIIPIEFFGVENKRQLRNYVGDEVVFRVVEYDRKNEESFVGSRIEARNQMAEITLRRVSEGDTIPFVVARVTAGGLFGDIGGLEAHLPISEIKYGWIDNPYDEFKKGDHMLVEVQEIEEQKVEKGAGASEKHRLLVSAKALQKNPWTDKNIESLLPVRSEHEGVVTGVTEYGVFISLLDGVDSLAKHLRFENAQKGDRVVVRIEDVDVEKEQVSSRILQIK